MSEPDIKILIENRIKEILFNPTPAPPPDASPDRPVIKFELTPFLYDSKCHLANIESEAKEHNLRSIPMENNPESTANSSQLIDLNVLTDFAAKHAGNSPDITTTSVILPHPELENNLASFFPGESISKEQLAAFAHVDKPPGFKTMCKSNLESRKGESDSKLIEHSPIKAFDKKNLKKRKKSKKKTDKEKAAVENKPNADSSESSPKRELSKEENFRAKEEHSPTKEIHKSAEKKKEIVKPKDEIKNLPEEARIYTLFNYQGLHKFYCSLCDFETHSKEVDDKHLRSEVHKKNLETVEEDKTLQYLPNPLDSQVEAITALLLWLHSQFGLSSNDLSERENLALRLRQFVESQVPDCNVQLIGSSVTGIGLKNCLADFSLKVEPDHSVPDSLKLLYEKLKSEPQFINVESEFKKKSPSIVFSDQQTKISCCIMYERGVAEKFAKLLSIYTALDSRVSALGTCFRYWANVCGIDNQESGTLPAFSYSILLVYFLQQTQPPVLPVLHELKEYGNADFTETYVKGEKWQSENKDSLGELWLKLFFFYNFNYEAGNHVVCIRHAKKILCSQKNWRTKFYAIEDPFTRKNIAHVIPSYQVFHYIQQCFWRTYRFFGYPQLKEGKIKPLKTANFDSLLLESFSTSKTPTSEELDESSTSENEDDDVVNAFEDQDPELSIHDILATLKKMKLDENTDDSKKEDSIESNRDKSESPKKGLKSREKPAKSDDKKNLVYFCGWKVGNLQLNQNSFDYKMDAVTFKGKKDLPISCKICKSSGHTKKNCPKDRLPAQSTLPKKDHAYLKIINQVLYNIRDINCVDDNDRNAISGIMREIEEHLRKDLPDACLSMFGSFCNGFGFKNHSDMDFCLTFKGIKDGKDLDSAEVIDNVAKQLKKFSKLEKIIPVTSAKVPIVKFSCTGSGMEGDISLYNTLALANTRMLEMYSKIDPRVQVLGFALKFFAKELGICDASCGSLSSYAYILMVIFFLQQREPPVIPVLQELYEGERPIEMIAGCNVWHYKDLKKLPGVWPGYRKNKESVSELLLALFTFYAYDFEWKEYVISIKQKAPLTRFEKLWNTEQLAIEDPFDLNHNLGIGLSHHMNMYILRTFVRARERFGKAPANLNSIHPYEINYLFNPNYLSSGKKPPNDRGCRKCSKIGHIAKDCPEGKTCSYCNDPGHLVKNCPQKSKKKKQTESGGQIKYLVHDNTNLSDIKNQHFTLPQSNDMRKFSMGPDLAPDVTRKLLQQGYPAHRLPAPPPGFLQKFNHPPPGFNPQFSPYPNNTNLNPPRFPLAPAPHMLQHLNKPVNNQSQSPPKQFSSSPPKNFPRSKTQANTCQNSLPDMCLRPGLPDPSMMPLDPRTWQPRPQKRPLYYPQKMRKGKMDKMETEW